MQNIIIPATLEQRVSWKTTLNAIVVTAGVVNTFTIQLAPVVTDATPGVIDAAFYTWNIRPIGKDEDKIVLMPKEETTIEPNTDTLTIALRIPNEMKRGYYSFRLILKDAEKEPLSVYTTYIVVNDAITPIKNNPFMSLDSVRSQFADISAADNRLLDSQEIGTWDICDAVKRCIEQWNNTAPRVKLYTGHTFPYPEILRRGVIYMLLQSLWTLLERNRMTYAAGNASVDLERRADAYQKLMMDYRQQWTGGMAQAKNEENLELFNGSYAYY